MADDRREVNEWVGQNVAIADFDGDTLPDLVGATLGAVRADRAVEVPIPRPASPLPRQRDTYPPSTVRFGTPFACVPPGRLRDAP